LIVRDPPRAAIRQTLAAGKRRADDAEAARHDAAGRITDGKLEAGNIEIDGFAAHGPAELIAG
jgi:hypothetical protein